MKNLLIYISPEKKFSGNWGGETDVLVKIQIDNSLALGWKKEDIMLVTNFDYEYNGVKALVIGGDNYCAHSVGTPSKINAIVTLFEMGLIEDDIYWFHDFDAFQLEPLNIELATNKIALTDYGIVNVTMGQYDRWSTGSIFFRNGSKDVFAWIKEAVYKYEANEEVALLALTRHNKHGVRDRINKLNITNNFATRRRNVGNQLKITDLPIKVIHFHPFDKRPVFYTRQKYNNMEMCVQGKNPTNKPLVTPLLISLFNKYGIS